jgi:hypothetical protein
VEAIRVCLWHRHNALSHNKTQHRFRQYRRLPSLASLSVQGQSLGLHKMWPAHLRSISVCMSRTIFTVRPNTKCESNLPRLPDVRETHIASDIASPIPDSQHAGCENFIPSLPNPAVTLCSLLHCHLGTRRHSSHVPHWCLPLAALGKRVGASLCSRVNIVQIPDLSPSLPTTPLPPHNSPRPCIPQPRL